MKPLISIVVPVYNTENYLGKTIESVLGQTYINWELLLVDDGSTDGSAQLCKDYAARDNRVKYIYKTNGGQASARNEGIKKSQGEYIAFLDSDDLYAPNRLEEQLIDLQTVKADFYYGGGYTLTEENGEEKTEPYDWIYGTFTGHEFFKILYHSCAVNINTVLIQRDFLNGVGLFDESQVLRGTEDWDLWLRIALKAHTVYGNPKRHVFYRIHAGGIHFQRANMLIGKWRIYEKYDASEQVPKKLRKKEYRYIFRELMNALNREDRSAEIPTVFKAFYQKDKGGLTTSLQAFCFRLFPIKTALNISNKFLYRIGYRLENLNYRLFST